jgi:taurine dioxygenase
LRFRGQRLAYFGDRVQWDNRYALHRRDEFDPQSRRLMHRSQIKGERPD